LTEDYEAFHGGMIDIVQLFEELDAKQELSVDLSLRLYCALQDYRSLLQRSMAEDEFTFIW